MTSKDFRSVDGGQNPRIPAHSPHAFFSAHPRQELPSHLRSANPWTTDNSDNADICIRRIRVISDIRGQTLRPFAMVAAAAG
jgi:hypothetical protein